MTDDEQELCGGETTDGTPCQNPADSCPWDHGGENDTGRDFAISEDDHEAILEAARMGKSERGCGRAAGVDWGALNRYLEAHPEFHSDFTRARAEGENTCIRNGRAEDGNPSFEKFMLSASYGYKKTEQQEVTGDGGGSITINTTASEDTDGDD